jgi:hypothetical protein
MPEIIDLREALGALVERVKVLEEQIKPLLPPPPPAPKAADEDEPPPMRRK